MPENKELVALHTQSAPVQKLELDFEKHRTDIFDEYFGYLAGKSSRPDVRGAQVLLQAIAFETDALGFAEEFANLRNVYIHKIDYLRNYLSLDCLRQFSMEEVASLYAALELVQTAHLDGRLQPEHITKQTRDLAHEVLNAVPLSTKEKWEDRDPQSKERAIDFLLRVWGPSIQSGSFQRSDLLEHDEELYSTTNVFFNRVRKRLEKDANLYPELPRWLFAWFEESAKATSQELEEDLKRLGIEKPQDAFNPDLKLARREQHRLYNAAKNRQQT